MFGFDYSYIISSHWSFVKEKSQKNLKKIRAPFQELLAGFLDGLVQDGDEASDAFTLQGGFDEVILHCGDGLLLQFFVGDEIGVSIYQAPGSAFKILIVLGVVGQQESFPFLLGVGNGLGVSFGQDREGGLDDGVRQVLCDLCGGRLFSL